MENTRDAGTAAYRSAAPQLRASDADRDRALAELSRHFEAGRLTTEELDERTGQALAARTLGDLGSLMRDLPADLRPAAPAARQSRLPYLAVVAGVAALCALVVTGLVLAGGQGGNHHPLRGLIVVLPALVVIRLMVRRRRLGPSSRQR
jgi:hypothetical protein